MKGSTLLAAVREDLRARAAYAEGAGIYRMIPASIAQPSGLEELRRLLACAREPGRRSPPAGREVAWLAGT